MSFLFFFQLRCPLPPWLSVSGSTLDGAGGGLSTGGFHCPALQLLSQNFSSAAVDPSYYAHTLCSCDANFFGRDGLCVRCPAQCSCSGAVVRDCFPVVRRGRVLAAGSGTGTAMRVQPNPDAVRPFAVAAFLPCPRTLTGRSLCNPDGVSWPRFYDVETLGGRGQRGGAHQLEDDGRGSRGIYGDHSDSDGDHGRGGHDDLGGWCYPGHTGRLCAQCAAGHFLSGRWCLRCLSAGAHAVIVAVNVALLLLLVALLYARMPGAAAAAKAMREYHTEQRQMQWHTRDAPPPSSLALRPLPADLTLALSNSSPLTDFSGGGGAAARSADNFAVSAEESAPRGSSGPSLAAASAPTPSPTPSPAPSPESVGVSVSIADPAAAPSGGPSSSLGNKAVAANPLKLLIFHSQQLGLLLQTTASLPPALTGFLGIISTGSSSFSLSSLVALECLSGAWTMASRCWLALAAPMLVGLVAMGVRLFDLRRMRSHGRDPFAGGSGAGRGNGADAHSDGHDEADPHSAAGQSQSQSRSPRLYGVCVSLLYLMVFPCAETALSALTCTDLREASLDADGDGGADGSARVFLNLFPGQQCDAEWQRTILPPALLGAFFWFLAFPVGSTLLFRRLRAQIAAAQRAAQIRHSGGGGDWPAGAAAGDDAGVGGDAAATAATAVWPLCSDLLRPYSRQYWYWEQVLLVRRLLLVAAVTVIPSASLYLPLSLFSLVQLSALLQHRVRPYRHSLLNSAELASLYLLLLNYLTALLLQGDAASSGGFAASASSWAALLFVINLLFLLALIGALFQFARTAAAAAIDRLHAWAARWLALVCGGGGGGGGTRKEKRRRPAQRQRQLDAPLSNADSYLDLGAAGAASESPHPVGAGAEGVDRGGTVMHPLTQHADSQTVERAVPLSRDHWDNQLRAPLLDSTQ